MTTLDPQAFYELTVAGIVQETPDSRTFYFDVPAELREGFAYRAGQFFTFQIPWGTFAIKRSYSVCTAPCVDPRPAVTVKRVDGGRGSNWFNDNVKIGDKLKVQPPAGRFVLHDGEAPLLLFGGGSGITPLMALAREALHETSRRVRLVYANRDPESVIFAGLLERMRSQFGERFEVIHHLDSEAGYPQKQLVTGALDGWSDAVVYICGPTAFMDLVENTLAESSFPAEQTHIERFVSPTDPDREQGAGTDEGEHTFVAGAATVVFNGQTHEVPYEAGEMLLDAARRAGLNPEFQCEEGYCACCMAKMSAGQAPMKINDALSDREVEEGWILTCQSRCTTPKVEIDYDAF